MCITSNMLGLIAVHRRPGYRLRIQPLLIDSKTTACDTSCLFSLVKQSYTTLYTTAFRFFTKLQTICSARLWFFIFFLATVLACLRGSSVQSSLTSFWCFAKSPCDWLVILHYITRRKAKMKVTRTVVFSTVTRGDWERDSPSNEDKLKLD